MTKFMVLYNSPNSAGMQMSNSSPEQVDASMAEWIKWRDETAKKAKVEFGLPLQVVTRMTQNGETKSDTMVTGYSTIEGEKWDVQESLKNHPHLKTPGATIDLLEMIPLEQM